MRNHTICENVIFWVMVTVCFVLIGCAGTATVTPQAMVPETIKFNNQFSATVSVRAQGGREKHPMGSSELSNEVLVDAVKKAIIKDRLFSSIVESNEDYRLNLFIVKVSHPLVGTDIPVTVEIGWTLHRSADEGIIWQKSIVTKDTASSEDGAMFNSRLIMAIQRSTQSNIQEGLTAISNLTL
jgi:hypothetical protein